MGLTSAGAAAVAHLTAGDGTVTPFNTANAYVGIGDSNTAEDIAHTDLQASTNKTRKPLDSAPVVAGSSVDYTATFGTGDANHAWLEIGVFNAASGGTMLSRKVIALPVKTSAEQWTITATVVYTPGS